MYTTTTNAAVIGNQAQIVRNALKTLKSQYISAKQAAEVEKINLVSDVISECKASSEYAEYICDYSGSTYICDAISEIADNNTSIYYSDIIKFISAHVEEVNDAIAEFGWDGCGKDLYKAGQMAEFCEIEREMYDNMESIVKLYAANYIRENYGEEISAETWEAIVDELGGIDNNDRLDAIEDICNGAMDSGESED